MRHGIGRLRAGGSGFSPSQISFTSGLWLDPSDISTGFQDSAGTTPQTASGQPTGKRLDKSGRGNHVLQLTGLARPEYDVISGISSDYFDGSDDGYRTAVVSAGTYGSAMDIFIAFKKTSTPNVVVCSDVGSGTNYIGALVSADATAAISGVGTAWSAFVNGVAVGTTNSCTRAQLYTAIGSGAYKVLEVRDLDLSAWTQFTVSLYAAFMLDADLGGIILCPAQSSTNRANIRRWLGAKVGLSL